MGNKYKNVPPISDEEEAEIQRGIASDADAPEITPEQAAHARRFAELFPELAANMKRGRGRPATGAAKEAVTLRLDRQTVEKFKATGPEWRTKMAEALKGAAGR
jgi:uncharacterized protein (DUF4415 family)